ncbi:AEC family transporter, partial [Oenococcus oeni]
GKLADSFKGNISYLIMNIALPLSIFVSVLTYLTRDKLVSLSGGLVFAAASFAVSYVLAYLITKIFKIRVGRRGTFINMFVNANTIFIGLPLNSALFGPKS